MKNENESEGATVMGQPKKLLLGKRVLRHFGVRSGVQTGAKLSVVADTTSNPDPTLDPSDDGDTKGDSIQTYSSIARCR